MSTKTNIIKKTSKAGVIALIVVIGVFAIFNSFIGEGEATVNAEPQTINLSLVQEQRINEINNKLIDLEIQANVFKGYKDCVESNLDWEEKCETNK